MTGPDRSAGRRSGGAGEPAPPRPDRPAAAPPPAGLGREVGAALGWGVAAQAARRSAALLAALVLTRLLDRGDYGAYTVAYAVSLLLLSVNDLGVGAALVRRPGPLAPVAPTGAVLACGWSAAVFSAAAAAAPALAGAFGAAGAERAEQAQLIRLLAVGVLIDGLATVPAAALTRELRERTRSGAELVGFAVSLAVTGGLALAGWGPFALAWGQLGGAAVTAALLVRAAPLRLRAGWRPDAARELVRFGAPLAAAGVLNQVILNADYLVVSRRLGVELTGAYFVAFNVSNWPVSLVSLAMRRAAVAGFARLAGGEDGPAALAAGFARALSLLLTAAAPMALVLALSAEDVLRGLFGPRWTAGAAALRFLVAVAVVRLALALCIDALTALGRSGAILAVQAAWAAALVPALEWGAAQRGLAGVGAAHLTVALGLAAPLLVWRVSRLGLRPGAAAGAARRTLAAAALAAAAGGAARSAAEPGWGRLALGAGVALTVYSAAVLWLAGRRAGVRELVRPAASAARRLAAAGGSSR